MELLNCFAPLASTVLKKQIWIAAKNGISHNVLLIILIVDQSAIKRAGSGTTNLRHINIGDGKNGE